MQRREAVAVLHDQSVVGEPGRCSQRCCVRAWSGDERVLHGPHIATVREGDDPGRVEPGEVGELVADETIEGSSVGAGGALRSDDHIGAREPAAMSTPDADSDDRRGQQAGGAATHRARLSELDRSDAIGIDAPPHRVRPHVGSRSTRPRRTRPNGVGACQRASPTLDSIDVVAVADPSADARAAAAAAVPQARLLAEPADAFEMAGVEACLLATPTPLHPAQVRAAIAAGLHVLCEKPLSLDPAESVDIDNAATRAGLILQLGFWRRYAPPWRAAKDALEQDRIGVPLYLRLAQWDADPPPASFCDPLVSGGLAIDCGVHEYDLAEWFSGRRVVRVRAYAAPIVDESLAAVGDVDNLVAVLELEGGAWRRSTCRATAASATTCAPRSSDRRARC